MSPHFQINLHGEQESVKDKLDHRFLQLNPSSSCSSTTSKHKSRRAHKVAGPCMPTAPILTQVLSTTPISVSSSSLSPFHMNVQTTPISISSSLPSPLPLPFHPQGNIIDFIDLMDSESSDSYQTPVKRRKIVAKHNQHGVMPLAANDSKYSDSYRTPVKRCQVVVKHEEHTSPRAPRAPVIVQAERRQWPSDYPVLNVVDVMHSCKPPPLQTTIAQHFHALTGVPFKRSTYYDTWSRWLEATQEQRDDAEQCGLWKNFAAQIPLR